MGKTRIHARRVRLRARSVITLWLVPAAFFAASTQSAPAQESLDSLTARALATNPTIRAAVARAEAARNRVAPTGAWPDPMLMAGIVNLPLSRESSVMPAGEPRSDPMTMRMVGVEQTIPYPGKLALAKRAAMAEVVAADAEAQQTSRDVVRDVKREYYELAFIARALEIVDRNRRVLSNVIVATETRYGLGTAGQEDVLNARVEAATLGDEASMLRERERAALARLNALLGRPSAAAIVAVIPGRIADAAVARTPSRIRFASDVLGARAADSPLPDLEDLQQIAMRESPMLRARQAAVAAQAARVSLARRAYLPDIGVSLQYGQRSERPGMVSAVVSAPIPIFKSRKQDRDVPAARAEQSAAEAAYAAAANELRADVAARYAEAERQRTRLALYVKAVVPQAQAALTSATASFAVGRTGFLTLLESQARLFTYETEYARALTDFAQATAELERIVGRDLP